MACTITRQQCTLHKRWLYRYFRASIITRKIRQEIKNILDDSFGLVGSIIKHFNCIFYFHSCALGNWGRHFHPRFTIPIHELWQLFWCIQCWLLINYTLPQTFGVYHHSCSLESQTTWQDTLPNYMRCYTYILKPPYARRTENYTRMHTNA